MATLFLSSSFTKGLQKLFLTISWWYVCSQLHHGHYCQFDKNNYFCRHCDGLPEYLQIHQEFGLWQLYIVSRTYFLWIPSESYTNFITSMPLLCMVITVRRHLSCPIQIYEVGKTQAQLLYWVAKLNGHFSFYLDWLRNTVLEHPSSPLSTSTQIYYWKPLWWSSYINTYSWTKLQYGLMNNLSVCVTQQWPGHGNLAIHVKVLGRDQTFLHRGTWNYYIQLCQLCLVAIALLYSSFTSTRLLFEKSNFLFLGHELIHWHKCISFD
jgi:hypothetical protein